MSLPITSSSSATSNADGALARANDALNGFVALRSKGVGFDMCMKTACWTLRLVAALSDDGQHPERLAWANTLVAAIIDERMMFNQWKWLSTGRNALESGHLFLKICQTPPEKTVTQEVEVIKVVQVDKFAEAVSSTPPNMPLVTPLVKKEEVKVDALSKLTSLFTFLTYFSRTFEQVQGDIGFWNRFWFTNWNSRVQSRRYKFFKSIALTMSLVVEILKIVDFKRRLDEAAARNVDPPSVTATPVSRGSASFDHSLGITDLKLKLRKSIILLIRNIGDMIIYYQWIEWYKPNRVLCGLCGMFSGLVGVYLVWTDNAKLKKEVMEKKKKEE